jgi:hypothetical protein
MAYINVGVIIDGYMAPTKKALRLALAENPESVLFVVTSDLGPRPRQEIRPDQIGSDTLTVVGPDPYRNRKWYASVKATPSGIKVS